MWEYFQEVGKTNKYNISLDLNWKFALDLKFENRCNFSSWRLSKAKIRESKYPKKSVCVS